MAVSDSHFSFLSRELDWPKDSLLCMNLGTLALSKCIATCKPFSPLLKFAKSFCSFFVFVFMLTLCFDQALECSSLESIPFKLLAASSAVSAPSAAL